MSESFTGREGFTLDPGKVVRVLPSEKEAERCYPRAQLQVSVKEPCIAWRVHNIRAGGTN